MRRAHSETDLPGDIGQAHWPAFGQNPEDMRRAFNRLNTL
jgi:hypothetical protein